MARAAGRLRVLGAALGPRRIGGRTALYGSSENDNGDAASRGDERPQCMVRASTPVLGSRVTYFLSLFSPETYEAFRASDQTVSGFRERQRNAAERVHPGDRLICYMTKLGRWFGQLEVIDGPFVDRTPVFHPEDDPFIIRFRVKPLILLEVEKAVPIRDPELWDALTFTREHARTSPTWTGKLRTSLAPLEDSDGELIARLLQRQAGDGRVYPFDASEYAKWTTLRVRRADKIVSVSVPEDSAGQEDEISQPVAARESHLLQALLADIGARMGMQVWLPRGDRQAVRAEAKFAVDRIVDRLPLSYDETTLQTIENIDVLWLKGRSIVRAFEVEHTTSVYSGILRMADLLALQPNMDIKLHIVAPDSRRNKVFEELRRPVFSLLERGPLADVCTFLSYDSIRSLGALPSLEHMRDSVLDEYAEEAE